MTAEEFKIYGDRIYVSRKIQTGSIYEMLNIYIFNINTDWVKMRLSQSVGFKKKKYKRVNVERILQLNTAAEWIVHST